MNKIIFIITIVFMLFIHFLTNRVISKRTFVLFWVVFLLISLIPFKVFEFTIYSNLLADMMFDFNKYILKNIADITRFLYVIYYFIALFMIFISVLKYKAEKIRVYNYEVISPINIKNILLNFKIKKCDIVISDMLHTPATFGIINSKLILPSNFRSIENIEMLIIHEISHIKGGHSLIILICKIVCCLNWCNPFVWLMSKYINLDLEMAADEAVINNLGMDKCYKYASMFNTEYISEDKNAMKRVTRIVNYKPPYKIVTMFVSLLLTFMLILNITKLNISAVDTVTPETIGGVDISELKINFNTKGKVEFYIQLNEFYLDENGQGGLNIVDFSKAVIYTNQHHYWTLNENTTLNIRLKIKELGFSQDFELGLIDGEHYIAIDAPYIKTDDNYYDINTQVERTGNYFFALVNFSSDNLVIEEIKITLK